jgi:hypothetical protein
MTAPASTISLDAIDAALGAATGQLTEDGQRLAVAVLRLLSAGHPVAISAAADAAAVPEPRATSIVRSWPAVFWNDQDQVTGYAGLTVAEMPPHRVRHAGADLSAWCAFDPLFLARIIGDLQFTTADPVTGEAISYHVSRDGAIDAASHPDAALSFRRPDKPWRDDVIATFCHYVLHFTGPHTARRWTAAHRGTFVISLGDAAELARRHTARTFGAAAE